VVLGYVGVLRMLSRRDGPQSDLIVQGGQSRWCLSVALAGQYWWSTRTGWQKGFWLRWGGWDEWVCCRQRCSCHRRDGAAVGTWSQL